MNYQADKKKADKSLFEIKTNSFFFSEMREEGGGGGLLDLFYVQKDLYLFKIKSMQVAINEM